MGHKILVITNSQWNVRKFRKDLIFSLCDQPYKVGVACPEINEINGTFKQRDVEFFKTAPFSYSKFNPFSFLHCLWYLLKIQNSFNPDIILTYTIKPNLMNGLICRIVGKKYIPVITGLGTSFTQSDKLPFLLTLLYRMAFKSASSVVFQNKDDEALFLEKKLVSSRQAKLIYGSGVDASFFKSTETAEKPSFLFIGRLLKSKGVREFVQASKELSKNYDVRIQMLGSYNTRHPDSISLDLYEEIQKAPYLEYHGYSDRVKPFIDQSSIVVLPSYREGLPKSILEAMSMGKAILVTDVSGCRDFFDFGFKPGLMAAVRSSSSLKECMELMCAMDKDQLNDFGQSGRLLVEKHFEVKIINKQLIDLINKQFEQV